MPLYKIVLEKNNQSLYVYLKLGDFEKSDINFKERRWWEKQRTEWNIKVCDCRGSWFTNRLADLALVLIWLIL